jgi:hypothetical protein
VKGTKCPLCGGNTLLQKGSVYVCSNKDCGFIGWGIRDKLVKVGSGLGRRCPICHRNTLQGVYETARGTYVWRCGTCSYSGIGKP